MFHPWVGSVIYLVMTCPVTSPVSYGRVKFRSLSVWMTPCAVRLDLAVCEAPPRRPCTRVKHRHSNTTSPLFAHQVLKPKQDNQVKYRMLSTAKERSNIHPSFDCSLLLIGVMGGILVFNPSSHWRVRIRTHPGQDTRIHTPVTHILTPNNNFKSSNVLVFSTCN